jgi:uncharacterized membrane protein YccF (DUF307 family)
MPTTRELWWCTPLPTEPHFVTYFCLEIFHLILGLIACLLRFSQQLAPCSCLGCWSHDHYGRSSLSRIEMVLKHVVFATTMKPFNSCCFFIVMWHILFGEWLRLLLAYIYQGTQCNIFVLGISKKKVDSIAIPSLWVSAILGLFGWVELLWFLKKKKIYFLLAIY